MVKPVIDEVIIFFINFFLKNWTNFIKITNDINPVSYEGRIDHAPERGTNKGTKKVSERKEYRAKNECRR